MLPARYHAMRNRTLAAVDRFRAEPVKLSFLANGIVDPDRPAIEIEGIIQADEGKSVSASGGRDRDWNIRVSAQQSTLYIDQARYPDLVIRRGDRARALARPSQPWFEVLSVDDRSDHRLAVHLGEAL